MNQVINISTEYIRPSRTIEILNLVKLTKSKMVYIYNYEGIHFRLFDTILGLIQFFELGTEPKNSFDSEEDLDDYLGNFLITEPNI